MKKTVLLIAALMMLCVGCAAPSHIEVEEVVAAENSAMTIVEGCYDYMIYKHRDTGVHYIVWNGYSEMAACMMVNADGTPYTGR